MRFIRKIIRQALVLCDKLDVYYRRRSVETLHTIMSASQSDTFSPSLGDIIHIFLFLFWRGVEGGLTNASHTSASSAWNRFHPTIVHRE